MESEMRSSMPDLPPTSEIARLARSPSALLNHLSKMSSDGEDQEEAADGTFQPPVAPDAVADNGQAASPDLAADTAADTPPAMPAPPAPARGDRPAPPPRQSEVIVPSDPTLN